MGQRTDISRAARMRIGRARLGGLLLVGVIGLSTLAVGTGVAVADSGGALSGSRRGAAASISAGGAHTCVKVEGNLIKCWGDDSNGQVGDGAMMGEEPTRPSPVDAELPDGTTATQISIGDINSCAVLDDQRMTCWGSDDSGQIGDGNNPDQTTAGNIPEADKVVRTPERVVSVGVGSSYACALFVSENVRCWGSDDDGQLGNGGADVGSGGADVDTVTNAPELRFPNGRTASAISAGRSHACAVLDDGGVSCWGANSSGQLGNGSNAAVATAPVGPLALPSRRTADGVSAGGSHTCALLDDGDVTCWGSDSNGQLGNGSGGSARTPGARVALPTNDPAVAVSAGLNHTCAVLQSNALHCWGSDSEGQLGNGDPTTDAQTPQRIPGGVVAVALGDEHTCALLVDQTITCWGSDAKGQLGNGPGGSLTSPDRESIDDVEVEENDAAPSPARDVRATGGRGSATVNWASPRDDGGRPITGYRIQQSVDNAASWTTLVESTGSTSTTAVVDATPADSARFRVAAINDIGVSAYSQPSGAVVVTAARDLTTFAPIRLHDSRGSGDTIDGQRVGDGPNGAGSVRRIQVTGRGGGRGVPDDATAAVLNVTLIRAGEPGFATVYPCTDSPPLASTVNYPAGRNVANAIVARLDGDGGICITTSTTAEMIVDATGFVPFGSLIEPIEPVRHLDTRPSGTTIDNRQQRIGPVAGGQVITVPIAGRPGVPSNATSALLNVTAVNPSAAGFATVYPCGTRPTASSLNFDQNANVANAVVAKLSGRGEVCIFAERTANFLIDVTGYSVSSTLTPITPARFLDTRQDGQTTIDGRSQGRGRLDAGAFVEVPIAGRGIVPASATAAAISVVAVGPEERGFLTTYPCGTRPNASTLNYEAGQNVPNLAFTALSDTGSVCVYVSRSAHVLVDVTAFQ